VNAVPIPISACQGDPGLRRKPPTWTVCLHVRSNAVYILGGSVRPSKRNQAWTYDPPAMRFYVKDIKKLTLHGLAIAEATFAQTGPVTLAVVVNCQLLERKRYGKPGSYSLVLPVPVDVLKADSLNTVTIEPDKVFVAKEDGAKLSFILTGAGFRD